MTRGKDKRARKRRNGDFDSDDDTASTDATFLTDVSGNGDVAGGGRQQQSESSVMTFGESVDRLQDAKAGRRLLAMKAVAAWLTTKYIPEEVDKWKETLSDCLGTSIVKGGTEEAVLACQCVESMALTLGKECVPRHIYEDFQGKLRRMAMSGSSAAVRGRAAIAYAVMAFMGCDDDALLQEAFDWFALRSTQIKSKAKAEGEGADLDGLLHGWTLLATLWRTDELGNTAEGPSKPLWDFAVRCLGDVSIKVRFTAGRCIALVLEAKWRIEVMKQEEEASSHTVFRRLEGQYRPVFEALKELHTTSGERMQQKGLSKTEKKEQSASFRHFATTAETGECPGSRVCVGSRARTLEFHSWSSVVRYECFKYSLLGATAAHMLENEDLLQLLAVRDRSNSLTISHHLTEKDVSRGNVDDRDRQANAKGRQRAREWCRRSKQLLQQYEE